MTASARDAALALLAGRARDATICKNEVARAIAGPEEWRAAMPAVHAAVDELLAEGVIQLSWKGRALEERAGPSRIGQK